MAEIFKQGRILEIIGVDSLMGFHASITSKGEILIS